MSTTSDVASTPFIVGFYDPAISKRDARSRTLDKILDYSDDQLEYFHDYVQYLFPLPERSPINPWAPVITKEVRDTFLARPELKDRLRTALQRMAAFYGFDLTSSGDGTIQITPSQDFETNARRTWVKKFDHNHLRITRIIRCLRVLGQEMEATAFFDALLSSDEKGRVSDRTKMFWQRAAERPLWLSPEEDDEDAQGVVWLRDHNG